VTILLQRLREELVRRTYAETTIRSYLHAVEAFRQHVGKRLDHLGPDDLRRYQVYLLEDRKLANGTVVIQISALRFFYIKVLKRRDMKEDLPYPKRLKRLPVVLSQEEVSRLIDCARNLFHRAMLLTMYAAGLRRSELCRLKVSNIDSRRMMLRIGAKQERRGSRCSLEFKVTRDAARVLALDAAEDLSVSGYAKRLACR
jgi:integrase/recombinase XerD